MSFTPIWAFLHYAIIIIFNPTFEDTGMCGRYSLYSDPADIANYFSATLQYRFSKSYNMAPAAIVPVIVQLDNERIIVPMRWGFIPVWHKEGQKLSMLNNAKIETVDTKPSFRASFKMHRCLLIANGFYEWDSSVKPKQPSYFYSRHGEPIALAGIWARWVSAEKAIDSCCILTAPANKLVAKIHTRMPVIISQDACGIWLDAAVQDTDKLKEIATSASGYSDIICHRVTTKMNRTSYDNFHCIKDIDH